MGDSRYGRGVELGCPDCLAFKIHRCPFLWADKLDEPHRSWALRHLADELKETDR